MATLKIFKVANNHNMENISLNLLFSLFHLKVTQLFCACPLFPRNTSFIAHTSVLTVQTKQTSRLVNRISIHFWIMS